MQKLVTLGIDFFFKQRTAGDEYIDQKMTAHYSLWLCKCINRMRSRGAWGWSHLCVFVYVHSEDW